MTFQPTPRKISKLLKLVSKKSGVPLSSFGAEVIIAIEETWKEARSSQ